MENHIFIIKLKLWGLVIKELEVSVRASDRTLARVYLDIVLKGSSEHEGLTFEIS